MEDLSFFQCWDSWHWNKVYQWRLWPNQVSSIGWGWAGIHCFFPQSHQLGTYARWHILKVENETKSMKMKSFLFILFSRDQSPSISCLVSVFDWHRKSRYKWKPRPLWLPWRPWAKRRGRGGACVTRLLSARPAHPRLHSAKMEPVRRLMISFLGNTSSSNSRSVAKENCKIFSVFYPNVWRGQNAENS